MLLDIKAFEILEKALTDNGIIKRFEEEHGKIRGRMMITLSNVPDEIEVDDAASDDIIAFCGSFDFYNSTVGFAISRFTMQAVTGIWITPQEENADEPSEEWIKFFVSTVMSNIGEDGSFGIPMYTFISDTCDFTVVPTIE